MSAFNQRVTRIKGLSDRRRLPRLGSIRLGIKAKNSRGVEYPRETEHFVVPQEVAEVYGDKPTELDIMLPLNEIDSVFPVAYKYYGSSRGLKCQGDGEVAFRPAENNEITQVDCPCELLESGKCKQSGTLMVMLPKVSVGGIYQIRTSSYNSIVDVQSGLDYVTALVGRFSMVPLKLKRDKTETHHDGKKQHHYTLKIVFDGNIDALNFLRENTQKVLEHPKYQLPAPSDENPELDPVDIIADEEELENVTQPPQAQKEEPKPPWEDEEPPLPEDPFEGLGQDPSTKNVCTDYKYLKEMSAIKSQIVDIDGTDKAYYDCLKTYDVEKSNQILDGEIQGKVYLDLLKYFRTRVKEIEGSQK